MMKKELYSLSEYENPSDRKLILELCSNINMLCGELEKFKFLIKNNINILLNNTFVSGAGMVKVKIVDGKHGAFLLHIFGNEKTSKKIPENIHIHDFQAISYICKGIINEKQFSFHKVEKEIISIYNNYISLMLSFSVIERNNILNELEKLSLFIDINCSDKLKNISNILGISIYELSLLHTIFDSIKDKDNSGKIIGENFYRKGVFKIEYKLNRKILEGESYFLSAENGHQIESSNEATTMFVVDKTYRTKGFLKDKGCEVNRGHGKRLPNMQKGYELREFNSYKISTKYLLNLVNSEINNILINN